MVWKAVVFDFGQVLALAQDKRRVNNMQKLSGLSVEEFKIRYAKFRGDYDRGVIGGHEYWNRVLGHNADQLEEFSSLYDALIFEDTHSWVRINPASVQFARRLKKEGVKTAILSNMPVDMGRYLRREHSDLVKIFDEVVFSFEIGKIKPEEEIYLYCVDKLKVSPGETLFIDDREVNVEGARRVGLGTYLFIPGVTVLDFDVIGSDYG